MSKSVLIVNTPMSCGECIACKKAELMSQGRFSYTQLYKCAVKDKYLTYEEMMNKKAIWCPLKDIT